MLGTPIALRHIVVFLAAVPIVRVAGFRCHRNGTHHGGDDQEEKWKGEFHGVAWSNLLGCFVVMVCGGAWGGVDFGCFYDCIGE